MKTRLLGAVCACLAAVSFNANAAIVDNGTYTTVDGVDWLDLTATAGMSYNEVTAQLGSGGALEGWSYASVAQVEGLWTAFGGDSAYYTGWSTQNNGLFDVIAPLFGDLYCQTNGCAAGEGYSYWLTGTPASETAHFASLSVDLERNAQSDAQDHFNSDQVQYNNIGTSVTVGSALTRTSPVPIPAAVWLFGTGLLGLFGVARRKVRT